MGCTVYTTFKLSMQRLVCYPAAKAVGGLVGSFVEGRSLHGPKVQGLSVGRTLTIDTVLG
jgi:hypothetical protein